LRHPAGYERGRVIRALLLCGASLLLACAGASAAEGAGKGPVRCSVSYDGLVWYALGPGDVIPESGAPACAAPERQPHLQPTVFSNRQGGSGCRVSYDGLIWYRLPAGDFGPISATQARCERPAKLTRLLATAVPSWAHARRSTRAIFAVASLQEAFSATGMRQLGALAHADGFPVTWLVADPLWLLLQRDLYASGHRAYGDDVQTPPLRQLIALSRASLPWARARVAVESGGNARDIERVRALGERAFWGIAWNSSGVDGLADRGAPWGAYCADNDVYKEPALASDCPLVALEWTARDLTAAYWSGREDIYSTDPDDLTERGGFDAATAARYARAIVDAYAAAGEARPLVVIAQQESAEMDENPLDVPVLRALYGEAARTKMHAMTLAGAAAAARAFAASPRAVAFPVIAPNAPPAWTATIDFHDSRAAMTFGAGQTAPLRLFAYDRVRSSPFDLPLPQTPSAEMPQLALVAAANGVLAVAFSAPRATHFGIAIWGDPDAMGWQSPNVFPAGRAGAVAVFDLPAGISQFTLRCRACTSSTFPYSF
jgi:hypothetical protein